MPKIAMVESVLKWFKTPYYFNPSPKFKLKVSLFHGLFIFLFLYIFRPFYLSLFEVIILEYTLGIGLLAFIGTFFVLYVPALIFRDYFHEDKWTIGKNLVLIALGVTFISFFIWYFGEMYKESYNLKKINFLNFLSYSFLISIFPLAIFIFLNEQDIRNKRRKRAKSFNFRKVEKIKKHQKIDNKSIIEIFSENKKESIKFHIEDLVYVTSQSNYASFFINKKQGLKEKILRVTLTQINKALIDNFNIVRCHKSYIVNTKYIKDISGNARGYLLKSDIIPFDIPVSRKFSKEFLLKLIKEPSH